jgi:hypothetical protein
MKIAKIVSRVFAAATLTSLIAAQAAATCDTGARVFPASGGLDSRNLACSGASATVAAQNSSGVKSVAANFTAGTRRARSNGIDANGAGMAGCFIEDSTTTGGGQSDTTGCELAVKWIGTLFT